MLIVSFTTIPDRLDLGLPTTTIQSILQQTHRPDILLINIPEVSRKGVVYKKEKAEELEKLDPSVKINWLSNDYGPITKLMGTIEYIDAHKIEDALICLVDDDGSYVPTMIEELIRARKENKVSALGYAGRTMIIQESIVIDTVYNAVIPLPFGISLNLFDRSSTEPLRETSFLETYAGVLYDAKLFLPCHSFLEWYKSLPKDVKSADDIIIAAWICKQKVNPYIVNKNTYTVVCDEKNTPALNTQNIAEENNNKISTYFIQNGDFVDAYYEKEHTTYSRMKYNLQKFFTMIHANNFTIFIFFIIILVILLISIFYMYRLFKCILRNLYRSSKKSIKRRER